MSIKMMSYRLLPNLFFLLSQWVNIEYKADLYKKSIIFNLKNYINNIRL